MITGTHAILYSTDAEADRDFLRDVLGFPHVDAGGGWLIFQLPPAELGVHPAEGEPTSELYLMCNDLDATLAELAAKGVQPVGERAEARWGVRAWVALPSGTRLGLYEPRHPVARGL
ncbi:VOC family protein [Catenulispora pinisilvae]|uniref:VOC family protein n=1 Tax=Catenulispora pinisilvae TaxID=2705253 RepID=UPI0018915C82|nr:VOC family protein [Catenulispora pinisilvae]